LIGVRGYMTTRKYERMYSQKISVIITDLQSFV
jgi:hypothetical protein